MKKIIYTLSIYLNMVLISCNPIEDRKELGQIIPASEFQLEIFATTDGGNQIVLENKTPGVGSYWDYIVGISTRQRDTVTLPFLGEQTILFKGITPGGIVEVTRNIDILIIDHPLTIEWEYFAGSGIDGKTWVWDYEDMSDPIWGDGGYLWDIGPGWTRYSAQDVSNMHPEAFSHTMTFNLNGGPNFIKNASDGSIVEEGTFKFNMTKTKMNGAGSGLWSIGELEIANASVMLGIAPNHDNMRVDTYDIIYLDAKNMVLAFPEPGIGEGGRTWYWKFKAKE